MLRWHQGEPEHLGKSTNVTLPWSVEAEAVCRFEETVQTGSAREWDRDLPCDLTVHGRQHGHHRERQAA